MRAILAAVFALICGHALCQDPKAGVEREPSPDPKAAKDPKAGVPTPTGLWAAQTSAKDIQLVWKADSRINRYEIFAEREKGLESVGKLPGNASSFVARLAPGRTNRFFIEATYGAATSGKLAFNDVVPAGVEGEKPQPPAQVIARSEPGRVTLSWPAVPGATAYAIGRSVKPGGFGRLCAFCPTTTTYVDEDITPGADHAYTVATISAFGVSRTTTSNWVRPAGEKDAAADPKDRADPKAAASSQGPPLPGNLWAAQTSPTQVTLTWTRDPRATGYFIYDESQKQVARVPGTVQSYVTRLNPGAPSRFYLEATDGRNNSERLAFNEVVPAPATAAKPPEAPASVTARASADRAIALTWPAVPGATGYAISRSVGSKGRIERLCDLCPTTTTSFLDNNTVPGEDHVYTVATVAAGGTSKPARSNALKLPGEKDAVANPKDRFDPKAGASSQGPPLPSNLWAAQTSATEVTLTWTGDRRAREYLIYGESPRPIAKVLGSVSTYVARLDPAGPNRFYLEATDATNKSERLAFNEVVPAASKEQPVPPASVTAAPAGGGGIMLSWPAVPGATGYAIGRTVGSKGGNTEPLCDLCPTTTSFLDRNAVPGQEHVYTVTTIAARGRSNSTRSNALKLPGEKDAVPDPKASVDPKPDPKASIDRR